MSTSAVLSQGCIIARGDNASPIVYTTIAEVTSIDGPGASTPEQEVTDLSSNAKEFVSALKDEGTVELEMFLRPNHATQSTLIADHAAGSTNTQSWRVTLTDSPQSTITFNAWVQNFRPSLGVDQPGTVAVTLRVTGAATWT